MIIKSIKTDIKDIIEESIYDPDSNSDMITNKIYKTINYNYLCFECGNHYDEVIELGNFGKSIGYSNLSVCRNV